MEKTDYCVSNKYLLVLDFCPSTVRTWVNFFSGVSVWIDPKTGDSGTGPAFPTQLVTNRPTILGQPLGPPSTSERLRWSIDEPCLPRSGPDLGLLGGVSENISRQIMKTQGEKALRDSKAGDTKDAREIFLHYCGCLRSRSARNRGIIFTVPALDLKLSWILLLSPNS